MARSWRTKLIQSEAQAPQGFKSLAVPTYRGSTTLFERAAEVRDTWNHEEAPYPYGLFGTPTTLELAARIAELEGGRYTFLTPGGQAGITLVYLALVKSGDHVLLPDSIYGPNRDFAAEMLTGLGVEVAFYDPLVGAGIEGLIRRNTRLVWCESPGSATMEVEDVPAIAAAAHKHGALVALDNTYSAGVLFDAFAHGVDVTVQAITKYIGGHSDLLLGSVTVRDEALYQAIGKATFLTGMAVSPDDCSLALRGLQTLGVRLAHLERSTLAIARWLSRQPEIAQVLHPALPSCPGHAIWQRDFTGSASVFSVLFDERFGEDALLGFIDRLALFKIGFSWGGVTSLVMPQFHLTRTVRPAPARLVRFNIGLEETDDLIADLQQAFAALRG
ncbi:MAG TPA: cystathionine beta-lyase [Dongiaceae bacterium]|jgi:cystathionine beta-lyase|nr:cystathionine beta-lyase [Dongiaceae bacterium]